MLGPPPPQTNAPEQLPQESVPPQASGIEPQSAPWSWQLVLVQPQVLALHWLPPLHTPQESVLPQPSSMVPHSAPSSSQVLGVQPQTLLTPPPPQLLGAGQLPQSKTELQPSEIVPQFAPTAAHVTGVHLVVPHWYGPPPPQNSSPEHVPQESDPSQESLTSPQAAFMLAQVSGLQPLPLEPPLPLPPPCPAPPPVPESAASSAFSFSSSKDVSEQAEATSNPVAALSARHNRRTKGILASIADASVHFAHHAFRAQCGTLDLGSRREFPLGPASRTGARIPRWGPASRAGARVPRRGVRAHRRCYSDESMRYVGATSRVPS